MDLLQSYAVLDDVVRGLQLYVTPVEPRDSDALRGFGIKDAVLPGTYRLEVDSLGQRFTLTAHGREGVVQEGSVGDSVGAAIGFVWVPTAKALAPRRRVAFTVTAPYEATGRLAKELKVSADLDGNFLRMALGGTNPALIAATVNAVADRFVEVAASLKREKLTELTRILGTQLAQAQRDLSAKQADLRTLRAHYTDASPAVRRLAAEVAALERQTIPALAGALAAELRVREQQLGERVDAASANLRKIPPLAVEETRLQRAVTLAEQVVVNLQQRYEEARLADVSSLSDVRVLDRAVVPQMPGGSLGPIFVVLALIGGLGLGVAGAVVLDYGDRHVHHPDQVTQRMGLTILGAVPHVDWHNGKREESAGQVIEALRGIRLSVANRHGDGPVVVTVTSPGRSDGKSFVASNLAAPFADAGFRTLLID